MPAENRPVENKMDHQVVNSIKDDHDQEHAFGLRVIFSVIFNILFYGILLFLPAGTFQWWRAWVFLGVVVIGTTATMLLVFKDNQELLNERFKSPIQKGQPLADKIVLIALIASFMGLIIFIPRDVFQFHLLEKPNVVISSAGLIIYIAGWVITSLAFKENAFAAPVVKHQQERAQKVIDTGVYSVVRHPIYIGGALLIVGISLWLESYAAALLSAIFIALIIVRILIEERFLKRKLSGYTDYLQRTRYRLIPHLW